MSPDPVRTCAGCRTKRPKAELIRMVGRADGTVELDPRGPGGGDSFPTSVIERLQGRGAYVCPDAGCIRQALVSGSIRRTLRCNKELPAGLEEALVARAEKGMNGEAKGPRGS